MIRARTSLILLSCLVSLTASARAETDFTRQEGRWNGIARFLALADDEAVPVHVTADLDARALNPEEAVILLQVAPGRTIARLSTFVERGGALVIADESDSVGPLMDRLAFRRFDDAGERASGVPGRDGLHVAAPLFEHPIVDGVDWIVTNLPRPFAHERLAPIVAIDEERHLVAIGRLGEGELYAIGDSSLFIDQMLTLRGNERFARNLLRSLRSRSRVHLVVGPGRVLGAPEGSSDRSRMGELRDALARIATLPTSPLLLHFAAVIALCGLVIAFASKLTRAEAFQGPRALALSGAEGGVAGRVRSHREHSSNLRSPSLVYRRTLYEAFSTMLDADLITPAQVEAALRAKGAAAPLAGEARALCARLDAIHATRAGRVSRRSFERLVDEGERLVEAVAALRGRRS